jgi:hypothetical protein
MFTLFATHRNRISTKISDSLLHRCDWVLSYPEEIFRIAMFLRVLPPFSPYNALVEPQASVCLAFLQTEVHSKPCHLSLEWAVLPSQVQSSPCAISQPPSQLPALHDNPLRSCTGVIYKEALSVELLCQFQFQYQQPHPSRCNRGSFPSKPPWQSARLRWRTQSSRWTGENPVICLVEGGCLMLQTRLRSHMVAFGIHIQRPCWLQMQSSRRSMYNASC